MTLSWIDVVVIVIGVALCGPPIRTFSELALVVFCAVFGFYPTEGGDS